MWEFVRGGSTHRVVCSAGPLLTWIGRQCPPGNEVGGAEGTLLLLGEEVVDILVEDDTAELAKREIFERDRLGGVEDVDVVVLGLMRVDDLGVDVPGGELACFDILVEAASLEIRVCAGLLRCLLSVEVIDALGGLEMYLDVCESPILFLLLV